MRELVVDNFAGGGGASTGIEFAIGRSVDIAITCPKKKCNPVYCKRTKGTKERR